MIGVVARYALVLPYEWRPSDAVQGLGMWVQVASLSKAGLAGLAVLASQKRGGWVVLLITAAVIESAWAVLTGNKLEPLLSILFIGFGYCVQRRSIRPVFVAIACSIAGYLLIAMSALALREEIRLSDAGSFGGRASALWTVVRGNEPSNGRDYFRSQGIQVWWVRLSYVNAQAFAMHEYQSGRAGDSILAGLVTPIPRIFWPSKPAVDRYGETFHESITGLGGSAASPGLFVEAYWNGGWIAVGAVALALGWVFSWLGRYVKQRLAAGAMIAMPVAVGIIRCALRPDGWFSLEVTAPVIVCSLFVVLERALLVGVSHDGRRQAAPSHRTP